MQRVQKLLANAGFCSRREAERLIEQGRVAVDGKPITLGDQAESIDHVTVDGNKVSSDETLSIAYYKPKGVQTTLRDEHTKSLAPLLREVGQRLIPAGRLDMDAEGLLILTNDGDLANRIMHPRYEKTKVYRARMDCAVTDEHLAQLRSGVELIDGPVEVEDATRLSNNVVRISIHEGRNKIVKRLMRKVTNGYVEQLVREQISEVKLNDLQPGQWRKLNTHELESLQ
jgi:23S rRNA pseudouridine2605 synthase